MRPFPVALSLALSALAPAQERLTPELLWRLRRVSEPQVSPDGTRLVYAVRTYELAANRGMTQLFMMNLEDPGAGPRQLTTQGSNFSAQWFAGGKSLAFLSTRSGSVQVHRLSLLGGEAQQVTHHRGGVGTYRWSPTGTHIAFTANVRLDRGVHELFPDLPHAEAQIYDDLMVRHWDQWQDGSYSHLFAMPVAEGAALDLMGVERVDTPLKPFGGVEQYAWSPDGSELCYTAKRVVDPEASTNSDLFVVPVAGGEHVNITAANKGYDMEPLYSPDGATIAYLSMKRAGFESDTSRLMLYDRKSGKARQVHTETPWSAHGLLWTPDGTGLYFTADTQGTTQIYHTDLLGAVRPVSNGRFQFASVSVGPGGEFLCALRCQTERPYEVVRLASSGDAAPGLVLTEENDSIFEKLRLPKVQERRFEATDGKQIHAWVIYPPDFDPARKWPMLLYCQGGPQSQVGQWFSYRWNFHLMAAQGYIVLAVNRRGLPGFGREWNDQISRDWGGQAMRDLLSATDAMIQEPYVDAEKVGAVGASFGGYSIYWLMGNHDERFACMISHSGVFDLRSMYLSTEELFFVNWDLGGAWWNSPEVDKDYTHFSPSTFVSAWDTPLLVIHGQRDYRVPLEQGLQAFQAAQLRGVPSRLLYFPNEGHWVLSPQNGVVWHRVFFDWLGRFLK